MKLSRKVTSIKPSPTLQLDSRAKELLSQGKDIISFGAGEPDFPTPSEALEGCKKAIDEGKTKYTPASGIKELKEAACQKFEEFFGPSYSPDEVVVTSGAKMAIWATLFSVVDEGDEVIILSPYWVSYPDMIIMCGGIPKIVETKLENGFVPTPQDIERAITPKTKAIILNFPSNPTGAVIPEDTAREIAKILIQKDIFVISDEIYGTLTYEDRFFSFGNIKELRDQLVVIWGVSKSYSMTGWRIGFAFGPTQVMKAISKVLSQTTSNPATPSQYAALWALRYADEFVKRTRNEFKKRRDLIYKLLSEIESIRCFRPKGAFYIFPDISAFFGRKFDSTEKISEFLLEKKGVLVIPGEGFGATGFVRLTFALREEKIKEGIRRFWEGLKEISKLS